MTLLFPTLLLKRASVDWYFLVCSVAPISYPLPILFCVSVFQVEADGSLVLVQHSDSDSASMVVAVLQVCFLGNSAEDLHSILVVGVGSHYPGSWDVCMADYDTLVGLRSAAVCSD